MKRDIWRATKKLFLMACVTCLMTVLIACGAKDHAENALKQEESAAAENGINEDTAANSQDGLQQEEISNPKQNYAADCIGVITISINPEIEFEIDADNKVKAVIYKNEDAEVAYGDLQLQGMTAKEATALVVKTADEKGYLKDGNDVSLNYGATGNATAQQSQALLETARDAVVSSLNDLEKDSAVVVNVCDYVQENSNVCDLCFGIGKLVCDSCGGKSYGNGMIKCDLCLGSGFYDDGHNAGEDGEVRDGSDGADPEGACRSCHGTGIMTIQAQTCYICGGTGKCINCGGSGIDPVPDDFGNYGSCHACGGSGDCLQKVCEGGIMVERHETCRDCGGTGISTGNEQQDEHHDSEPSDADPDAKPAGTCYRCDGLGYMTCKHCNGELMATCNRCGGSGINEH